MKSIPKPMDSSSLGNNLLTVFTIGGTNGQLLDSFGEIQYSLVELGKYDNLVKTDSIWKMFLYSDEMLSAGLRESLMTFLEPKLSFDFYSLYRKGKVKNGGTTYSLSPRIFRSHIELKPDCVYPKSLNEIRGEIILNGFLLEQE